MAVEGELHGRDERDAGPERGRVTQEGAPVQGGDGGRHRERRNQGRGPAREGERHDEARGGGESPRAQQECEREADGEELACQAPQGLRGGRKDRRREREERRGPERAGVSPPTQSEKEKACGGDAHDRRRVLVPSRHERGRHASAAPEKGERGMGQGDDDRAGGEHVQDAAPDARGGVRKRRGVERGRPREVHRPVRQEEGRQDARRGVVARRQVEAVARVERVEGERRRKEEDGRRERAAPRPDDSVRGERNREKEDGDAAGPRPAGRERRDERERHRASGDDSRGPAEEGGRLQRIWASS